MRIFSKFHDYYDTAAVYGFDPLISYLRDSKTYTFSEFRMPNDETFNSRKGLVIIRKMFVGFCGQIYPVVEFSHGGLLPPKCFYNKEEAEDYARSIGMKGPRYDGVWRMDYKILSRSGLNKFFALKDDKRLLKFFQTYKTPIFLVRDEKEHDTITVNPFLKQLQFFKVKDAPTAFQEIQQYISGILGQSEKPTVEISDKYKAIAHGHDGKYSFRKPPSAS